MGYAGRLAFQQRVLPVYRKPFFDLLAASCDGGLSVFAGEPQPEEGIKTCDRLKTALLRSVRNLHFSSPSSPFYLCWQVGILDWLSDWKPDVLVVEANPRNLSTWRGIRWMRSQGKPVLGWGLGAAQLLGPLGWLRRWNRRRFLHTLDGVIAYSQRGAEEYLALGLPLEKVWVAPNAVKPSPQGPPPDRPPEFEGEPTVIFVGRLQARKRVDILLRACQSLPSDLQPRLLIVGDGPAREELEVLANQVYPQTEFLRAVFGADLETYLAEADLFVLPGTGGLAVQQAMASGLPVVVAQGDGTQEDLVRPENGWQVPEGDLTALKLALREALQDSHRLRRMGRESYKIVREEINLEVMVEVFVSALAEVAER
jgi:glycosyltransferase involved in cell wall biosynthesis